MFNYLELNENVLYFAENIKHYLSLKEPIDDTNLIKKLNLAINICLKCNSKSNELKLKEIKNNTFFYLLSNHLNKKLLVPSPSLKFDVIIQLAIVSGFEDLVELFERFEPDIAASLYKQLIDFINRNLENSNFDDFLLFSLGVLLNMKYISVSNDQLDLIQNKILNIINTNTEIVFDQQHLNKHLNKVLGQIYSILNFNDSKALIVKQNSPELYSKKLLQLFDSIIQDIEHCITMLSFMIRKNSRKFTINKLNNCLKLLSLLKQREETNRTINEFYIYMKQVVEFNYDLAFDDYYIIKNKLIGFESSVNKSIFEKDFIQLNEKDVEALLCVKDYLANERHLYLVLKMLNSIQDECLNSEFSKLFWIIFEELTFESKKSFIANKIYLKHEIKLSSNNSIECLHDSNFNNDLTLIINQLSYENCEDSKVLTKIAKMMCISLEIVVNKLVKNALNNKTQIPTLIKILNQFSVLLKCEIKIESKYDLINDCLKQNLESIILNHNDKMSQNYQLLLKELAKQPKSTKFDFNEYFSQTIKPYLNIKNIFEAENSLSIAIDIFEIIYKCLSAELVHLAYFLELLTFLNFYKTNETKLFNRILNLKEKCISLIKQLVKYLNYQNPAKKDQIEWLKNYSNQLYWPHSSLIASLTKHIILPSCFQNSNKFSSVTYFEAHETSLVECFIELISINPDLSKFEIKLNDLIDSDEIQCDIISKISQNKTASEIKSIFEFVHSIINKVQIEIDFKIIDLIHTESEELINYIKFLQFFIEIFYIMNTKSNIGYFLSNFYLFLKGSFMINQIKNAEISLKSILFTIYYIQKLFLFYADDCQELCRFSIELLNQAVRLHADNSNVEIKNITNLCKNNLVLIDEKYKNYIYLISKTFDDLFS